MTDPHDCFLEFCPTGDMITGRITRLTAEIIESEINNRWWTDSALRREFASPPIDRDWGWRELEIERGGRVLPSELVGILTADNYLQGAMLVTRDPVQSMLEPSSRALFIELLFTAPRNRSNLRKDGRKYIGGIGPELLRWGVSRSESLGCKGRLALEASPDYVIWYEQLGFLPLPVEPVLFEGVQYLPMELPSDRTSEVASRSLRPRKK